MSLRQVLVLTGDDDRPRPETLGLVAHVGEQAGQHVVYLADIDPVLGRAIGVGTDQKIDAGPLDLRSPGQFGKTGARAERHLAGPVHDLGGQNSRG